MPTTKPVPVKELKLDLNNFRTVPQSNETDAVQTMISIAPDRFWALAESLLDGGYLPTENIIVLKNGDGLIVKEGNRRIGALKLIFGHIKSHGFNVPEIVETKIKSATSDWKAKNEQVSCAIYDSSKAEIVDKIITLAHGKGEKASRDNWTSVARARHNRDKNKVNEPALDLLEKYLQAGKNLTLDQRDRWSGDYPLTVLDDTIKRIANRLGCSTAKEVADAYPTKIKHRTELEKILLDVGLKTLVFETIRNKSEDFAHIRYGLSAPAPVIVPATSATVPNPSAIQASGIATPNATITGLGNRNPIALATNDPKSVIQALKRFSPKGNLRNKVVTLLDEARKLKLDKHPHAFCFLLRSMFEISAKAYCHDFASKGGPAAVKADGNDRALVDVLRDICTHLTKNNSDKLMVKELHGAMAELAKPDGFLSVTSLNQLVHNPKFTVDETHISSLFNNVFPLLQALNR